jgi:hypothetical protein
MGSATIYRNFPTITVLCSLKDLFFRKMSCILKTAIIYNLNFYVISAILLVSHGIDGHGNTAGPVVAGLKKKKLQKKKLIWSSISESAVSQNGFC